MDRLVRFNVLATSGRAVEAAGDVDTLLLDKTGTITFGNRMASEFIALPGVPAKARRKPRFTRVWRRIAGRPFYRRARESPHMARATRISAGTAYVIAFTAQTRLSGVDVLDRTSAQGRGESVFRFLRHAFASDARRPNFKRASSGSAAMAARPGGGRQRPVLGVIYLKDVVKPGIRERFAALRAMGIKTAMITGDNPLTAASIATEAGVDDFLAEATPEDNFG